MYNETLNMNKVKRGHLFYYGIKRAFWVSILKYCRTLSFKLNIVCNLQFLWNFSQKFYAFLLNNHFSMNMSFHGKLFIYNTNNRLYQKIVSPAVWLELLIRCQIDKQHNTFNKILSVGYIASINVIL